MPSWQARFFSAAIRLIVRRRSWGDDEQAAARRARRVLGTPRVWQWLRTCGLSLRPDGDAEKKVCGEWLEADNAGRAVILYIHGGGYVACSAATHRPITAALARLSRCRVFSLDYRLAPTHRFPAALDDAFAAYRWLLEEKGQPASALALAGDSAGGGLVLATLLRARDAGLPLPACAVCFSPWTDLAGTGASICFNNGRCAMFRPANIHECAAAYLGGASARAHYASPVRADLGGLPPLFLQASSTELLLDDARRVYERMPGEARRRSRLKIYKDVPHCWQMFDGVMPEARTALRQAAAFIHKRVSTDL